MELFFHVSPLAAADGLIHSFPLEVFPEGEQGGHAGPEFWGGKAQVTGPERVPRHP